VKEDGIRGDMTCVITGATSGIGRETAVALARAGARVVGVGRDARRCAAAQAEVSERAGNNRVVFEVADLSSQRETRELAARISSRCDAVHVLVNNAGLFRSRYQESEDGIEMQFAVNHLAAFLLTGELLPLLRRAGSARVIGVSSGSHFAGVLHWKDIGLRRGYFGLTAYDQSKLAVVMYCRELARRLGPASGVSVYAVDPGLVRTEIGRKQTGLLTRLAWRFRTRAAAPPGEPAGAIAFLALDPGIAGKSGLYWKDRQPVASSAASCRPEDAARLWSLSERMCMLPVTAR
jgi:NAD(P)-dependent dehydrogenase (short-subunit alcohol dehydrogenase family)